MKYVSGGRDSLKCITAVVILIFEGANFFKGSPFPPATVDTGLQLSPILCSDFDV